MAGEEYEPATVSPRILHDRPYQVELAAEGHHDVLQTVHRVEQFSGVIKDHSWHRKTRIGLADGIAANNELTTNLSD
jgi:hypothetical protein